MLMNNGNDCCVSMLIAPIVREIEAESFVIKSNVVFLMQGAYLPFSVEMKEF